MEPLGIFLICITIIIGILFTAIHIDNAGGIKEWSKQPVVVSYPFIMVVIVVMQILVMQ